MKILAFPQTPRAVADARQVICDPVLAASLPETLRRLAFMIVASQYGVQIRQRRRPANDYGLATIVGMKGDFPHPFSSDRAAAQFHLLADEMSPAEASRDPIPAAWQIGIAITCGAIVGGLFGLLLGQLMP